EVYSAIRRNCTTTVHNTTSTRWGFGEKELKAWSHLKEVLTQLPNLHPIDSNSPIALDTDASQRGIGACLCLQKGNDLFPVAYASHAFTKHEAKWPIRELEAFAIVWALRHFRQLLLGRNITIRTDHESLRWMRNCDKGRIARWNSSLDEFDLQIIYSKGKENQISVVNWSDALGRGAVGPYLTVRSTHRPTALHWRANVS
ncbi:putative enzymatic polyprotein, partial [Gregarina niphandrodes]